MSSNFLKRDAVIIGSGIAASSCALRLLQLGIRPVLISHGMRLGAGTEAIPESVIPLLGEMGLQPALLRAGAECVEGFDNHWRDTGPVTVPGRWIYIDRRAFAHGAVEEAVARGATLETRKAFLTSDFPATTTVIDATGRSAVRSRPLEKRGGEVATLFTAPRHAVSRARLVRTATHWAYVIPLGETVTVGVVGAPTKEVSEELRIRLGVNRPVASIGRRPAFVQRSLRPLGPNSIAIGDAALAFSPLAGHGIRFALQSAFAAAAVVHTWYQGDMEDDAACEYYKEFLRCAWRRHLTHLEGLQDATTPVVRPIPGVVRFVAATRRTGIQREAKIAMEEAVELSDGELVRWVGGFDLLTVRKLATMPVGIRELVLRLSASGLTQDHSWKLVTWCVNNGVLGSCTV